MMLPSNLTLEFSSYCGGCPHFVPQVLSYERETLDGDGEEMDYELSCEHKLGCKRIDSMKHFKTAALF